MARMTRRGFIGGSLLFAASAAHAANWPMYRNATHDGHTDEKINTAWPKGGPPLLWKVPMGLGFSAVSVVGNRAFVNGEKGEQECCFCLDADTGKQLWATPFDKTIHDNQGGDGPRSTPTVEGERVYVFGTHLKLLCLNTGDGKIEWEHDLEKEYSGREIHWGSAASPVLDGDRIFVNCGSNKGKSLLAFDKSTGKNLWAVESEGDTHASPTPANIGDVPQVIFFTQSGLVSVKQDDGKELWRWKFSFNVATASSPIVGDDMVYCSAFYGGGAGACKVTKDADGKFTATDLWRKKGKYVCNHWTTPVYYQGYLYGLYKEPSQLRCLEMATGKQMWAQNNFAWQGATVFVDGNILVQNDGGELFLVEANPKEYHELAHCKPLSGKSWTMPVVANGRIYCRSDHEVACLDVRTA
jgi:outer membrane protein assembly factor BamB